MKRTNLFVIAFILLFSACSKSGGSSGNNSGSGNNGNPQPGSGSTDYIKSITTEVQATSSSKADTSTITFTYDGQNRCTQSIRGKDTTNYSYTAKSVTSQQGYYTTVYYLNTAGTVADSALLTVNFTIPGLPPAISKTLFTYGYDANGYLIRRNTYLRNSDGDSLETAEFISYTNGNLTQDKDTVNNTTTILTYNNQTTSTIPLPPDPLVGAAIGFGPGGANSLLGHSSTNLIATIPETIGAASWTLNFAYVLDSKNRISTVTQTSQPSTQPTAVSYYTYY